MKRKQAVSLDGIKNSAGETPGGASTVLNAPMCNGGLVLPWYWDVRERPNANKVSMRKKNMKLRRWRKYLYLSDVTRR
jgi:hypothetical protein